MKNNQKLKGKDLINIGIYAALYCVLMTCISMLGYIPIMMPMLTVIVPIILGVPMMLFYTKVKKFGMITIMATIVGIYLCVTGMGFWPILFGVVFGFLADLIAKAAATPVGRKAFSAMEPSAFFCLVTICRCISTGRAISPPARVLAQNISIRWETSCSPGRLPC